MLYVYYGEDTDTARKKVQATVAKMLAKNPDALYFRITSDELANYNMDELTGSQALFKSEYIVVLDNVMASKEGESTVLDNLDLFADASHPFFVLEGKVLAPVKKKFEKKAAQVHEFAAKSATKAASFNTFALTDALGDRNVRKLWTLFREAKMHNISDEEIHGILFWMFKSMALAAQARTPEEVGMKPYPFQKAQRAVQNFGSIEALLEKTQTFALMPQHARRRGISLEIQLERFILSL